MPEVDLLTAPLAELLSAFGTGAVATDPAAALRSCTELVEGVHTVGRAALGELAWDWAGAAAETAVRSGERALADLVAAADRGTAIADVAVDATTTVVTGAAEIARLIDSFTTLAERSAPLAALPQAQMMLLVAAVEHIAAGLDVLARVTSALAEHTARMAELMPSDPASAAPPGQDPAVSPGQGPAASQSGEPRAFGGPGTEVRLPDGSVAVAPNRAAADAVRHALSQQGTPYVWGGTVPGQGLDCSGLTQWAYGQAGVQIPRLAQDQDVGTAVDASAVQPGDLAVWDGHVAMIVGNGLMVEAGDPVQLSPIRTTNGEMGFQGFFRPTG
ncbi:MAG: C40 family peptidase [Rhodococcus sp. (in: high G+C Gram-positive bacteria)]|nr:C40 family peptidase [Rhodococcus sp. (in: high G+C Gram-positive bacteria)]MDX5454842.1 C40 family peptidase [Rhodococcus sp. (in: high G+C Gram-positive bacteria)]